MRIAFLGDSLTWGGYGGNFVKKVAEKLPDHEIINAGEGGNTVINLLRRLDDVLELEPDGIFVMIGGNDAISYLYPDTRGYYRKAQQIETGYVSPEEFEQSYRDLLTRITLNHIHVWVGLAPTEYSPELLEIKQRYNRIARKVANSLNIPVLDFEPHFAPENVQERPPITIKFIFQIGDRGAKGWDNYEAERKRLGFTYTFDGMHILPETAEKFAALIVEFLREYL